jgi:hypothetical protein
MAVLSAVLVAAGCYPVPPDPAWEPGSGSLRAIGDQPPRVLIFGDSIADQQGSHAVAALREVGVDTLINAWWGWGLFSRDQYDMGATNANPPAGSMMEAATATVDSYDPDVVVVYSNHNYWPPFPRDRAGQDIGYGTPQFREMVQTQITELVARLSARGAAVYLVKPVPSDGFTTATTNAIWQGYMSVRQTLGFGVINSGDILADLDGARVEEKLTCAGRSVRIRPENDLHLTYFGAGLMGTITARGVAGALGISLDGITAPAEQPAALLPQGPGYRLMTCDGATFRRPQEGPSLGGIALRGKRDNGDPIVAATNVPPAPAAWAVTAKGKVHGFRDAPLFGHVASLSDGERATGIVATASGRGYWIVTNQGVVHGFGDAAELGDLAGTEETVVGMAGTPDRTGYWLLTGTGRVIAFGSAARFGDLQGAVPPDPVVSLAPHPSGAGYWILDAAGNVHPFGAARGFGSAANQDLLRVVTWAYPTVIFERIPAWQLPTTAVSLLPTASGNGYWVLLASGAVCHFGDAGTLGGIHAGQLDFAMVLLGLPFYGAGDCAQLPDAPPYPP